MKKLTNSLKGLIWTQPTRAPELFDSVLKEEDFEVFFAKMKEFFDKKDGNFELKYEYLHQNNPESKTLQYLVLFSIEHLYDLFVRREGNPLHHEVRNSISLIKLLETIFKQLCFQNPQKLCSLLWATLSYQHQLDVQWSPLSLNYQGAPYAFDVKNPPLGFKLQALLSSMLFSNGVCVKNSTLEPFARNCKVFLENGWGISEQSTEIFENREVVLRFLVTWTFVEAAISKSMGWSQNGLIKLQQSTPEHPIIIKSLIYDAYIKDLNPPIISSEKYRRASNMSSLFSSSFLLCLLKFYKGNENEDSPNIEGITHFLIKESHRVTNSVIMNSFEFLYKAEFLDSIFQKIGKVTNPLEQNLSSVIL